MKLVILFGPHAVGKMTVGQELCKLTELKLFHNHMTIDVVSDLFDNMPAVRSQLTKSFRRQIFEAYAGSEEYGMVFTFMWAFDLQSDWDYMQWLEELFTAQGAQVYYVELCADYDQRLLRNKTENRLLHKPTKRNLQRSEEMFVRLEEKYRLNTHEGELTKQNYIKIDNTGIAPDVVAGMIKERFDL